MFKTPKDHKLGGLSVIEDNRLLNTYSIIAQASPDLMNNFIRNQNLMSLGFLLSY